MQFFSPSRKIGRERTQRFEQQMCAVDELVEVNKRALPSFGRAVALSLQARRLSKAFQYPLHAAGVSAEFDHLFFSQFRPIAPDGQSLYDLMKNNGERIQKSHHRLRLAKDVVLPWPWHREQLIKAFSTYGTSKGSVAWRPNRNHKVRLILPFGLGLVDSGNHSIAAGIADGEGELLAEAWDISVAYEHIFYDGCAFRRKHDGICLSSPCEEEPGVLFELGRRMLEHGAEYDAPIEKLVIGQG